MSFFKNCWIISRKPLCHIFPDPHFPRASLSPNTGISRKTATNTVPSSGITLPDWPVGKSPAVAKILFEKEITLYDLAKSCNLN
jgi:hypothetical protein